LAGHDSLDFFWPRASHLSPQIDYKLRGSHSCSALPGLRYSPSTAPVGHRATILPRVRRPILLPGLILSARSFKQLDHLQMALCGRLARRVPTLTGQSRSIAPSPYTRSFTTRSARPLTSLRNSTESPAALRQLRAFTKVASTLNKTQTAPSADAYLKSGAIAGAQNLVDVKKVLVIGSGGLSIGQAGEFDYSGMRGTYS
jgi:hypothetical protein